MKTFEVWPSIAEIAEDVQSSKTTALEQVEKALAAIDAATDYHAILSVTTERARTRAKEIDTRVKAGEDIGRFAGVPFIAKDNYLAFGSPTTAASHILRNFEAPYQATAIEKLEAEGAILVAKSNLDSFAHGSSTENSAFGPSKNPHDITRVPGGSSGGSAAAVALGLTPFALGTDTGGSIRLPASYCGVIGYKPTYGLVSRYGVVAMASSTDVLGPFANTVADTALVLDVLAGRDQFDGTTIERQETYLPTSSGLKGKKIGIIKEFNGEGLDHKVKKVIDGQIAAAKAAGAEIVEVSVPLISLALAVYYVLVPAEVSSNLSRYDGQRYGLNAPDAQDLNESYELAREEGFEAENKRRILIGTYVLSSGYYDAYYKKAQTVRTKLINEFNAVFEKVDFLIGPTAPSTAFKLGENVDDPLAMYLVDIMTVSANLTGIPSISIPVGFANNLPVGMQLMAPQSKDAELLQLAAGFEELKV
jgi:aspartyl-tRNA(Asn)/glutamyl-tRNA(Gln) amidotransferase subunit A